MLFSALLLFYIMKKILFFIGLVFLAKQSNSQIIITVAGNGTIVWAGDTGQATAAPVSNPIGIAFDSGGNMYIADFGFSMVHKVNTSGIISQFAGSGSGAYVGDGGPATAAGIAKPFSVTYDGTGNIYIADRNNNVIRKVNTSGIITTVAGDGTYGYSGDGGLATLAQLEEPNGVACDTAGNIYITSSNSVRKLNISNGIITTIAGDSLPGYTGDGGLASVARLHHTQGITVDAAGNIYVTDSWNNVIRKINTAGIITTITGNGFGAGTGSGGFSGDGGPALSAELNIPIGGVAFDATGNMFIADNENNRVRMVNTAGIISTVAGNGLGGFSGDGGIATVAELYNPMGVALDAAGNLYIADASNYRIRKVSGIDAVSEGPNVKFQINIYPNPSNGQFTFVTNSGAKQTVDLYDVNGRHMFSKIVVGTADIDANSLDNGVYTLTIKNKHNIVYKKLIIAR